MCSTQGHVLPKADLACFKLLVGQWVKITRGHFKAYNGLVKDVGVYGVSVEIQARLITSNSPNQFLPWSEFGAILLACTPNAGYTMLIYWLQAQGG
jgi:hypothetical protein